MSRDNLFLLHFLELGVWFSFLYDGLRILRRVFPRGILLVSLEDLGFWIYCGAEVFVMMQRESNGSLRWYGVLAALVGMWLYLRFISPLLLRYGVKGLRLITVPLGKGLGKLGELMKKGLTGCGRRLRIKLSRVRDHRKGS